MRLLCGLLLALSTLCGAAFPKHTFTDTEGMAHATEAWAANRATVLFFVATDCPLSNGYVPELNRIAQHYGPRKIAFYAVQGDATVSEAETRRHAREFGYRFPYLFDPHESLAAYTGATTTPQAAVLSPDGHLLYLGRIDNRLIDFGKQRPKPTEFDLRDALEAILSGQAVPHPRTVALGCAIVPAK